MSGLQARKVIGYMVLPGIIPRCRAFFAAGFGQISFLMAQIYAMVRLLPPGHAYLQAQNIGKFSIRHVIAEAARHLVLSRKNIDQIIIFFALLLGSVLLLAQIALLAFSVIFSPASAQIAGMFETLNPTKDIAFTLLDRVFGIPGFFCSSAGICSEVNADLPFPFHAALHAMFQFYSTGLLLVGVLIVLYFIVVIVVETATSGTPFGKRFQNIWVPIRLVVAIGLLVPVVHGYNSGQYIAFLAAKMGSGFATNAWILFNNSIKQHAASVEGASNPTGEKESLIAYPSASDVSPLVEFVSLVHTCAYAYWKISPQSPVPEKPPNFEMIKPYFVKNPLSFLGNKEPSMEVTMVTTYKDALEFYNNSDIIIRFGEKHEKHVNHNGVMPLCGELRLKVSNLKNIDEANDVGGPAYMFMSYFNLIKTMWFADPQFNQFAGRAAELRIRRDSDPCSIGVGNDKLPSTEGTAPDRPCDREMPSAKWKQFQLDKYQEYVNNETLVAWKKYADYSGDKEIDAEILSRGWAGAGIWYNRIAEMNGAFITSVMAMPYTNAYPKVLQDVLEQRRGFDADPSGLRKFCPGKSGGTTQIQSGEEGKEIAKLLCEVHLLWNQDGKNQRDQSATLSKNYIRDLINLVLGTSGIFDMRGANVHTHPLAQLVAVGKALVESAVGNVMGATGASVLGGLGAAANSAFGGAMDLVADFAKVSAFIGLTAGFVLFYVLPFLPFLFFFFAVSSWIRALFEAMVGIPLWALAHLRLDGEGLPGESAQGGYFLIFEIFLRPILTVFALIAAILIFSAQVRILNFIWDLVTANLTGFQTDQTIDFGIKRFQRGEIDAFFFTIIYTIIVYMMATTSFKLIDKIPDGILRWTGSSATAFGDTDQDPTEGLTKYAATGGMIQGEQITTGIISSAKDTGSVLGKMISEKK